MKNQQELPKTYEAKGVEATIYERWESAGTFKPKPAADAKQKPFVIALPPPNATGTLHLGHATMLAIQDIMVRYHRLKGDATLWIPGTDHAAIATQNVVEKQLWKEEKKTRHDVGRDELLRRIDAFVKESQGTIRAQFRRMGASLDWSHERFTLDETLNRCVRMVFKMLYDDKLIYRGNRIVNWCTRCQTTLADDEVEYKEEKVPFYNFTFGPFSIGTVRPETKLGDKYVVVHPDDKRYTKYHGFKGMIPWINGEVEMNVITDEAADPEMGSGAMTITPQHSFVDFEIAGRHKLEIKENLIGMDGKLTPAAGEFAGLEVREARKKFVEMLDEKKLIEKIDEDYIHNVSVCYRCGTPVEPLISKQWFVDVNKKIARLHNKSLREQALEVVGNGDIKILPENFSKIYKHWMNNLHDWCISRQIWYGHRIPVWYKLANGKAGGSEAEEIYVGIEPPEGNGWEQDPDTLDTWFSSSMWTFSTLLASSVKTATLQDWMKKSPDFKTFHPTSVLETGYDILFFWVARMILMTTYAVDQIPFRTVYLHGLVRDKLGRKMSKSLGNGIDPVEMIEEYGADAVRLSLVIGTTPGNDIRLYEEKIATYRNFVNKLWNISRYILMSTTPTEVAPTPTTLADEWILYRFDELKREVEDHIKAYRFSAAGEALYDFTWNKLADWYVEFSKIEKNKDAILRHLLKQLLVLWHPFTPFVTEHIWSLLDKKEQLITSPWPDTPTQEQLDADYDKRHQAIVSIEEIQLVTRMVRDHKQKLGAGIEYTIVTQGWKRFADQNQLLSRLATIHYSDVEPDNGVVVNALGDISIYAVGDVTIDTTKLEQERQETKTQIERLEALLGNKEFTQKAPKALVAKEEERLKTAKERLEKLSQH
ncbi:valine--tRNA ligase [Candidatus Uhrbacteria bacterium CG10_big_fil_rev_8_21_14_0_10_48_11]|uniref:Valine--tRNA ligase n=1 Tax=Candidatus Uhrbacteria bacterium CG10_big_fil_rev_8_21_14_0_10_48_11 TaxID=1975037 RepID=A0A2M8LF35_9BACT|nr:MAG: valine--tRNA ligase [Candidatus Uhrbacteria bacterium CG10_big_fil_rev_8_21_14_0_10_48_11]